jgi:hypothetical protein
MIQRERRRFDLAERRITGPAVQRSRVAGIIAAIAALMLVYVIAVPALAQSPSASPAGSPAATTPASPGGQAPSPTGPDTAVGDPGTTAAGSSPVAFLLLGIGAVAAVLVYMGMRGSELRKASVGSERDPRS